MIGAIGLVATSGQTAVIDPAVQALLDALHVQEHALAAVAIRLAAECARIPHAADSGWDGPARAAYDSALQQLRSTLNRATDAVGTSLHETRVAISSLERRIA